MTIKNKIINVISEKIVFPGRSLCRCSDGIALFAEGILPGERGNVFVLKDKKTFREGILENITLRSKERVNPICLSFGFCGGCTFQNTSYETQIKYKQEYVEEILGFIGIKISKILISPQIWNYRNKMEFSFFNSGGMVELGLHKKNSFDKYISVPPCFIADKDFLQIVKIVKDFVNKNDLFAYNNKIHKGFFRHLVLRKAKNNNQFLVNIVTNANCKSLFLKSLVKELSECTQSIYCTLNGQKSDVVLSEKLTLMNGKPFITEKLCVGKRDYFFNISPFSFFQTNSKVAEIMYNKILNLLNLSKNDTLLDLYCGTGTIGITMACNVKKVVGVDQYAIENAKENSLMNNALNVEFYTSSVENWLKKTVVDFDVIIVDPPRSGLTRGVINFLMLSKAKKILYISCNPSTLVRDLQIIVKSGKYKTTEIIPIDMFPQTYHIEVMVLLEAL
ncbi:MAG: 23S rRNA (uracil(1939)-C(5))-methyltransferase RlmD [Endomicrobium sp.]|jgi:23S rRNA (uracil-5-)-methyltransferase RumA|nr:23S rRNA (uracil(1939)-C(5))-methyltransferase RlmD [Endomicrobium sp.]